MGTPAWSWLFFSSSFLILQMTTWNDLVSGQCLSDQRSHLLHLKNDLTFNLQSSTKLAHWNPKEDCCSWKGVGCDASGHVTSLDLQGESISGGIENSTSLFSLWFLERLNLAFNSFGYIQIPRGFANLSSLVYLNLSSAGFSGQVPIELSSLRRLFYLDLSDFFPGSEPLKLENPNLERFVRNLQNLRHLYLDGVDLSSQRSNWSRVVALSLPHLTELSLSKCNISGPVEESLIKIQSLSAIILNMNNLSTTVPKFLANFSNLRILSLGSCNLLGSIPKHIFQVRSLESLDLSYNKFLKGTLHSFPENGTLRSMRLSFTSVSGPIPHSISNLRRLSRIELSNCDFNGSIPSSMEDLADLTYLDFSFNNFKGPVPSFRKSKNLVYIDLSHNGLTGSFSTHFGGLNILENLHLGYNALNGSLPSSIFILPSLRNLLLSNNQFSGQIPNGISSPLNWLDLSSNRLFGSLPKSLFELEKLNVLSLSFNSFSGSIELGAFRNPRNLTRLELSDNNLEIESIDHNLPLPELSVLNLANCNLKKFPGLEGHSSLSYLDLSRNTINGKVPNWIWSAGNGYLIHVNLSFNFLDGLQKPFKFSNLAVLDLHSNQLQGEIPIPPPTAIYVDYSSNKFSQSIPQDIGNNTHYNSFFSVSNNSLTGSIPESICSAINLEVLDLSHNALNGTIPSCVVGKLRSLGVLNLARNKLRGTIPDTFQDSCRLKTLDLSMNGLEGKVPRSLANCKSLEVLNIGNNKIEDTFPCIFENSSGLHVLVLRSNKFHGELQCLRGDNSWSQLQIIDIASNNFSGVVSPEYFSSMSRMASADPAGEGSGDHLRFNFLELSGLYYQDKVTVTMKGLEMELTKILTIFISMDFSCNKFTGKVPDTIGDLRLLYILNLSHNGFTGQIPALIGKLRDLGSLDLSTNQLIGGIPATLVDLTFLTFLNLSFNDLHGRIPTGYQFQTFPSASYMGNPGLCGYPMKECGGPVVPVRMDHHHIQQQAPRMKLNGCM